jgi:hypothetical protein
MINKIDWNDQKAKYREPSKGAILTEAIAGEFMASGLT